jgi:HlyD family secretion protein
MRRLVVWVVIVAILAGLGFFGWRWYQRHSRPGASNYRLAEVKKQDVVSTISATGTVVPEDVIDVGAQVNGQIASFGVDTSGKTVDFRSTIKKDSVLAKIDDTIYAADAASSQAQYEQALAQVKVSESTRDQAKAKLDQAERDWARAQKLGESKALSQADYDASQSAYEQAKASLAVAEAQIGQSKAQVAIASADVSRTKRNVFLCVINSPVDGVIIDRKVDIGQTVVSSLNAPSLFLIAKDLKRMQVLVQVNEADIGHVKDNAPVTFTADAFPGRVFKGEVRKVRLNATMTQNVVTYTVEIVTDNSDLTLLPYLTANVRFLVERRDAVLAVPNAALRWVPSREPASAQSAAAPRGNAAAPFAGPRSDGTPRPDAPPKSDATSKPDGAAKPDAAPATPSDRASRRNRSDGATASSPDAPAADAGAPQRQRRSAGAHVYVLRDEQPTPISVRAGLTDGSFTEITSDELKEGDQVIVGEIVASSGAAPASTNPFAPQPFRPGGGGGAGGGRGR